MSAARTHPRQPVTVPKFTFAPKRVVVSCQTIGARPDDSLAPTTVKAFTSARQCVGAFYAFGCGNRNRIAALRRMARILQGASTWLACGWNLIPSFNCWARGRVVIVLVGGRKPNHEAIGSLLGDRCGYRTQRLGNSRLADVIASRFARCTE